MSSSADTPFVPIRPNPFIVGNPVRGRAMFFGREAEFELVRKRFSDSDRGALLIFCGERRSGKTSILFQILDRRLGPQFIPVLVDMQSMASTGETEFLSKIIEEIRGAVAAEGRASPELPEIAGGAIGGFQAFVREVLRQDPARKLVLLFDEYELFESKIESGALSSTILSALAGLMEQHPVFLIFTGSQHLEQRKHDYWKIFLPKSTWKVISYLERSDAINLIRQPVQALVHYDDDAVEAIYRLTSGQAFYTQAICQNLVDLLNEHGSRHANRERVLAVVDGLVNTPLPQMIFLWDSLERDEKLFLALLAECLGDERSFADISSLSKTITRGKYPLHVPHARLASAAEKLFRAELLLKDDRRPSGYAFRMDLWRLWIARMHSVWQVMREEGIPFRPRDRAPRIIVSATIMAIAIVGTTAAWRAARQHPGREGDPAQVATPLGTADSLRLTEATPPSSGALLSAPQTAAPAVVESALVTLRAGPGVQVAVNGQPWRRTLSPLRLPKGTARFRCTIPEIPSFSSDKTVDISQDTEIPLFFNGYLNVIPTPSEASVFIDSVAQAVSFVNFGKHHIAVRHPGYAPVDSDIVVVKDNQLLPLTLEKIPPGILLVKRLGSSSSLDSLQLDQGQVFRDVIMHPYEHLAPGKHVVRVWEGGQVIDTTVEVRSRVRTTFDPITRTTEDEEIP